jgi:hypothetical protein
MERERWNEKAKACDGRLVGEKERERGSEGKMGETKAENEIKRAKEIR